MRSDSRHNYSKNFVVPTIVKNWPFKIQVASRASSVVSPYLSRAIGIDVSRYNIVKYSELKGVIDYAFCKCSQGSWWIDPMFATHVQGFHDIGIPVMAYHWWEANDYVNVGERWYERIRPEDNAQLQNLLHAIEFKDLHGLWMDSEQTGNPDPQWSVGALFNFMPMVDVALREKGDLQSTRFNAGKFFFGTYSGEWHYKQAKTKYDALMSKVASNGRRYDSWSAKYPYSKEAVETTWEDFRKSWLPDTEVPVSSLGSSDEYDFWQISGDKFKLPGIYTNSSYTTRSAVDVNLFNGTREELYAMIGFEGGNVEPVEPTPPEESREWEEEISLLDGRIKKVEALFDSWN